jgi:hypothetical protein
MASKRKNLAAALDNGCGAKRDAEHEIRAFVTRRSPAAHAGTVPGKQASCGAIHRPGLLTSRLDSPANYVTVQ